MRHHQSGMDTRIGAPGTYDKELSPQKQRELLFDGLLHGDAVGLRLPSVVGGAIILKIDEISHARRREPSPMTTGMTTGFLPYFSAKRSTTVVVKSS